MFRPLAQSARQHPDVTRILRGRPDRRSRRCASATCRQQAAGRARGAPPRAEGARPSVRRRAPARRARRSTCRTRTSTASRRSTRCSAASRAAPTRSGCARTSRACCAAATTCSRRSSRSSASSAGESNKEFTLVEEECIAACANAPCAVVGTKYFLDITPGDVDKIIAELEADAAPRIGGACDAHRHRHQARHRAVRQRGRAHARRLREDRRLPGRCARRSRCAPRTSPNEVKASNLRGRGGAGFATGVKWGFVPKDAKQVHLVCNADESEPGTCKDRELMYWDPHLLIEGMIIAAHALKAVHNYIYIRGEMMREYVVLQKAVDEAYAARLSRQEHPRHRRRGATSPCIAAPARTSAARRPRCSTRSRACAASRGSSRRSRRSRACSATRRSSTTSRR